MDEAFNFAAVFENEKIEIKEQCRIRGVADDLKLDEEAGSPVPDRLGIALSGAGFVAHASAWGSSKVWHELEFCSRSTIFPLSPAEATA